MKPYCYVITSFGNKENLNDLKRKDPDYRDFATLFELAVIEDRFVMAEEFFYEAKPLAHENWMFGSTNANLEKILNFRKEREEDVFRLEEIVSLFNYHLNYHGIQRTMENDPPT